MSPQGRKALTERFEGLELEPYRDSTGIVTGGYGHTSMAGPPVPRLGQPWTAGQADSVLAIDLRAVEHELAGLVRVALTQPQSDAVIDLVFNIGVGNFRSSSVLRLLNAKKLRSAADAFLAWDRAGGRALPGLARRREAERAWFLRPALPAVDRVELVSPRTQVHAVDHPDPFLLRGFNRAMLHFR